MKFLLRITVLLMLPPLLMSCASYEFGEYPLTQSEISYFSRVDPSAAIVTDLGGNTFDVYNPTLHADVFWYLGGWSETIPFSLTRFLQMSFAAFDTFPMIRLAYLKGYEACRAIGLESKTDPETMGDFTKRFQCLEVDAWVRAEVSRSINFGNANPEISHIKSTHHPCYPYPHMVKNIGVSQNHCDAYTDETGFRSDDRFSLSDLATLYEQKAIANRRVQESISSQDQCKAFGFTDDTPEMANCLLELYKIANQPQQNTVITNSAPARANSSDTTSGIELMNRGLQILNGVGTPSAPRSRTSTCTRIGDFSGQIVTFNNIACPAGYTPTF
jgi:hypothetical protein